MKRLFCGGTVVSAAEVKKKDVLTEDGVIVEIGENIEAADAEIVDVTGKYLPLKIKGRVWHLLWNIGIRKRMGAQAAITPFIWRFRIGTRQ